MQLHYKGFSAYVRYSAATEGFYGEVADTLAVIAFQSSDLTAVESVFQEAIDQYLRHIRFAERAI
jgi:predicted HicB family RNase H-like nuclease